MQDYAHRCSIGAQWWDCVRSTSRNSDAAVVPFLDPFQRGTVTSLSFSSRFSVNINALPYTSSGCSRVSMLQLVDRFTFLRPGRYLMTSPPREEALSKRRFKAWTPSIESLCMKAFRATSALAVRLSSGVGGGR